MAQTIINEVKNMVSRLASLKNKYFINSKKELYSPEEVDSISDVEYRKLYNMGLKNFNEANEEFKKAENIQDKIFELRKMLTACGKLYNKRNTWGKYTIYRAELLKIRQILKTYIKDLEKVLEESSDQLKDGNVDELNDILKS